MKGQDFTYVVITADQHDSRRSPDGVPAAVAALADVPVVLPFERTAGDEIQALLDSPAGAVDAALALVRLGWHVGIGLGSVETPLPDSTRAARGEAYVAAREAVALAKRRRAGIAVVGDEDADAAMLGLATLAGGRSEEGWAVATLLAQGLSGRDAAARLGITPSAGSQRARRAHVEEIDALSALAARLVSRATKGDA